MVLKVPLRIYIAKQWFNQEHAYVPLHGLREKDMGWLYGAADWVVWSRPSESPNQSIDEAIASQWLWMPRFEFKEYVEGRRNEAVANRKPLIAYQMFFEAQQRTLNLEGARQYNPTLLPNFDAHYRFEWQEMTEFAESRACPFLGLYNLLHPLEQNP
jgi:hypothetical protein